MEQYANDEIDFETKIGRFMKGDKIFHHYDMGTTTETLITIMGNTLRKEQEDVIRLLARNSPPVHKCKNCGEPAKYVYQIPDEGHVFPFYCAKCHDEYGEYILPITNSPRMGECGYCGERDTYAFDPASVIEKEAAAPKPSSRKRKTKNELND